MTVFHRSPWNGRDRAGSAPHAAGSAEAMRGTIEALRRDVERLLMITEALWTMVAEQHGYTEEELIRRIHEIDLRDQRLDGRVAPSPPSQCPHCGRPLEKVRPYCIYCGKLVGRDPFER